MDRTDHATVNGTERPGHVTVDGTDGAAVETAGRESDGNGRRGDVSLAATGRPGTDTIDVEAVDGAFRGEWNDLVDRSPHGTPFHRFEFLEAIERHSDADLYPLVGREGDEPVGVFPLFRWQPVRPLDVVFSPPPRMGLYVLGPAGIETGEPARTERRNRRFVRGCMDWLDAELAPAYVHVATGPRYGDVRPFAWNGYGVASLFTYVVDLDRAEDDLFMAFSGDARSNVRECREADCTVEPGGVDAVRRIVASVNDRYAEQGNSFRLDPAFVTDLYHALPEGRVRPYVTWVEGEFAGGMVALQYGGTIYRWQGGTVPDVELPVNDHLDWNIIQDAMDRGLDRYDLVGANTERLCEYKAKFDPDLAGYSAVTGGNRLVRTGVDFLDDRASRFRESIPGI